MKRNVMQFLNQKLYLRKLRIKEGGITLIALVVTIVVLIILASISIVTLTGDNGIINKVQEAKNKTENAERDEETKRKEMYKKILQATNGGGVSGDIDVSELEQMMEDTARKIANEQIDLKKASIKQEAVDEAVEEALREAYETQYPAGSIYISTNATMPQALSNLGTWQAFGAGRTIVGVDTTQTEFNTVGKTGGEKTHTLKVNEMPSHSHRLLGRASGGGITNSYGIVAYSSGTLAIGSEFGNCMDASSAIGSIGDNQPHNNLQPYITVYMWKRTS